VVAFCLRVCRLGQLGFVHFYFGTGKRWLLAAALGLRLLAVVMNFSTGLNLHVSAIQSLKLVNFLGEPVSMLGMWTPNPWCGSGSSRRSCRLFMWWMLPSGCGAPARLNREDAH